MTPHVPVPDVAAIVPTHNPRADYLSRTLDGLRGQTLPAARWELVLVDNRSSQQIPPAAAAWHPNGRVVREDALGLTAARLRGLAETRAPVMVWVDDDNILGSDYLRIVAETFATNPQLGATGGRSIPQYEVQPSEWFSEGLAPLGCRDLGPDPVYAGWTGNAPRRYPSAAPIGAGLAIRREAMQSWAAALASDHRRPALGRTGDELTSGEDNDIVLTLLGNGWQVGYEPSLTLQHLIPAKRLTTGYLMRIAHAASRDFTRVLLMHDASPWGWIPSWTVPLRKVKAWVAMRAWTGPAARIRWAGACGHFEGRRKLHVKTSRHT
jgi:glycosyltransferase involved in cell wall biosynthesis